MRRAKIHVRPELAVSGCDPEGLVRVSEQFAELELEMVRRSEITAAQVEAERADWGRVAQAMGQVYQTLCDENHQGTMDALKEIEGLLAKRGFLVPQPHLPQPQPTEVPYGE